MRDVKTGFMSPTMDLSDDSAIRNFAHSVGNSEGILFSFVQDFSLYRIADFDTDTGVLSPISPVIQLIDGPAALRMMSPGGVSNG
ncbi:nonstructural protein [Sigmofec virus UA08Rod_5433]|uniref:Nonstructural protein n=1 Tax=Sigmofec virus UA08Rod_5433 TaxID=2929424 RepID=A0A976N159_9VIRU|nr:nonstructural protein [Sigmofec virus UA08Rod_5433]